MREIWRERYKNNKEKYNLRSEQWAKDNPEKMQVSVHTTTIKKKYPEAITPNSPNSKELLVWFLEQKGIPCYWCGQPSNSIDHIVPLSRGGIHELFNMKCICNECNLMKRNRTEEEFKLHLQRIYKKHK